MQITFDWTDPQQQTTVTIPEALPTMHVGDSISFTGVNGRQASVRFPSPFGEPSLTVLNGEVLVFKVGGIYQFQCFLDGRQATNGGGSGQDAFVSSLTLNLAAVNQSTYLGGTGREFGQGIARQLGFRRPARQVVG